MKKTYKPGGLLLGLGALFAVSAQADPVVTQTTIDSTTKGLWVGTYGECYNVLPQGSPRTCFPEIEIGPDFISGAPEQYDNIKGVPPCDGDIEFEEAVCITGDATDNFDFRAFTDSAPGNVAYVWGFDEPGTGGNHEVAAGTSQENACMEPGLPDHSPDAVYASTFDSDQYSFDPLSTEITMTLGGDATLAFYFLSEADVCRSQAYNLKINNVDVPGGAGSVDDISQGLYVVMDVTGIPDGATVRLDVTAATPSCGTATGEAFNSHLSGIFVDGTDACRDPFCGDGTVDPGETCDPPDSDISPEPSTGRQMCTASCNYCGDGMKDPGEECDPTDPSDPNAKMCNNSCEIIVPPLGCRFTGGLNDKFEGNRYSAGGQAGANTALQPQPKGEWTHRQRRGPAGKFTFHGGTASAPLGSEIDVIRCSDPGGCKPSGDPPSPVKQLDFDGIGTFKNIGKKGRDVPDFVEVGTNNVKVNGGNRDYKGTLHWFEVNIDDLGEPGNTNPKKNPGDGTAACPATGFGEKGAEELASCSCSDFYRITIYDGVNAATVPRNPDGSIDKEDMNTTDVIYEVWGYINGGNLQLHHPTGFDLN